jgi:hypothetical protein
MSAFEDERQTELNLKFHFVQRSKHTPTLHLQTHWCFQSVRMLSWWWFVRRVEKCSISDKRNRALLFSTAINTVKGKGHAHNRPQRPKGVPGRLRPRIFLTFGTTRVVGRQPHAPAAFTPSRNPWYSFLESESTPGHTVPSVVTEKIPSVTSPGIDPETVRLVAQCLNHYATPE